MKLALLLLLLGQPDETAGAPVAPQIPQLPEMPRGMPAIDASCREANDFGGSELERAAWCVAESAKRDNEKYPEMRTLADHALRMNPRSYRAHFLLGVALHLGEANLPKSLHHLERAEQLFYDQEGRYRPTDADLTAGPWFVMRRLLLELVYVHGEMDHHEEKITYVDRLEERMSLNYEPLKAWPLMKLKRWDEARAAAKSVLEGDPVDHPATAHWRAVALTALCAIESELRSRDAAYEACMNAAASYLDDSRDGGVALSNAAAAAVEMFKFDEAERLYIEATRRDVEGTINPWGRLVHLYLRQGRFAEALSALREMKHYRNARPAYFDQQDLTDAELTGASLLMIAGRMQDALRITSRTAGRPDRQGTSSAASEQNEAGNLIIDRVVRLDVARRLEEEASYSPFKDAVKLRAKAAKLRLDAWIETRKTGRLLADPERLITSLRPECPGSVELPSWLDQELVFIVGPGVVRAGLEEARAQETLPKEIAGPIFALFEAQAALEDGDDQAAKGAAEEAIQTLLPSEALLRARAAAIAAKASIELGDPERAMQHLQMVLMSDPGLIRRLGHTLPVVISAAGSSPAIDDAIDLLEDSPLFEAGEWGFGLVVSEDRVMLTLSDGTPLSFARVAAAGAKDETSLARRIARAAHEELLVPNVDVTQADVRSLDGGLGGGGRASERAKSVLQDLIEQP